MRPPCCVNDCDELAISEVRARWSMADPDAWPACEWHLDVVWRYVRRLAVDSPAADQMYVVSLLERA